MKKIVSLSSLAALVMAGNALSIEKEAPEQNLKEKGGGAAVDELKVAENKAQPAKAWLGVSGQTIEDGALLSQLNIANGVILRMVAPDGPAAKSGLKQHDVITKIGDKDVHNMEDLRAALSEVAPNEEVQMDVITGGKLAQRKVVPGERPAGMQAFRRVGPDELKGLLGGDAGQMPQGFLNQLDPETRKRVEKMMGEQLENMGKDMQMFKLDMGQMPQGGAKQFKFDLGGMKMNGGAQMGGSFTFQDNEGSVSLKESKDGKQVEVKDKDGKLLFRGPYETKIDKAAVPDEIRERINATGVGKGMSGFNGLLRLGGDKE